MLTGCLAYEMAALSGECKETGGGRGTIFLAFPVTHLSSSTINMREYQMQKKKKVASVAFTSSNFPGD